MNWLDLVSTTCDRCEKKTVYFRELRDYHQIHNIKDICDCCGNGASKFVDYWGNKKQSDLIKVRDYINRGQSVIKKYSALMNAGYI
jgi:hypothetical protein